MIRMSYTVIYQCNNCGALRAREGQYPGQFQRTWVPRYATNRSRCPGVVGRRWAHHWWVDASTLPTTIQEEP
jgi:hypothetical protein